jgi:hypothetical protein
MATYSVHFGTTLIGHSELEFGDPPMGVAFGKLLPTPEYQGVRSKCIAALAGGDQTHLNLSVRGADGVTIPAAGVGVLDAVDLSMEEIEVEVLGIPYPLYAELFPGHVRAYETKFEGDRP